MPKGRRKRQGVPRYWAWYEKTEKMLDRIDWYDGRDPQLMNAVKRRNSKNYNFKFTELSRP